MNPQIKLTDKLASYLEEERRRTESLARKAAELYRIIELIQKTNAGKGNAVP